MIGIFGCINRITVTFIISISLTIFDVDASGYLNTVIATHVILMLFTIFKDEAVGYINGHGYSYIILTVFTISDMLQIMIQYIDENSVAIGMLRICFYDGVG